MNPYKVILGPIVTEKSTRLKDAENKYAFWVNIESNKIEIKKAIEELFKVEVLAVRTIKVRGKYRRLGMSEGITNRKKKALVTVKKGQNIKLFEGV